MYFTIDKLLSKNFLGPIVFVYLFIYKEICFMHFIYSEMAMYIILGFLLVPLYWSSLLKWQLYLKQDFFCKINESSPVVHRFIYLFYLCTGWIGNSSNKYLHTTLGPNLKLKSLAATVKSAQIWHLLYLGKY